MSIGDGYFFASAYFATAKAITTANVMITISIEQRTAVTIRLRRFLFFTDEDIIPISQGRKNAAITTTYCATFAIILKLAVSDSTREGYNITDV